MSVNTSPVFQLQVGKVVYNADYLAFGSQYTKDSDFEELHGFTGKEYDPDIGLYYFNARWYDPDTGRFLSEDPVGQGPNPYSYCGNNPVMRVDPTGEFWWILAGALLGGLDSYLNGGDFLQGFAMGAITGALGGAVGTALQGTAWGAALAETSKVGFGAVSGAIGGGITGELFGEGFGKGAVFGAVSGAISGKIADSKVGDFAKKNWFNNALVDGLKGGFNALARGGDFVEGFAYGFKGGITDRIASNSEQSISNFNYLDTQPQTLSELKDQIELDNPGASVIVMDDHTIIINKGFGLTIKVSRLGMVIRGDKVTINQNYYGKDIVNYDVRLSKQVGSTSIGGELDESTGQATALGIGYSGFNASINTSITMNSKGYVSVSYTAGVEAGSNAILTSHITLWNGNVIKPSSIPDPDGIYNGDKSYRSGKFPVVNGGNLHIQISPPFSAPMVDDTPIMFYNAALDMQF